MLLLYAAMRKFFRPAHPKQLTLFGGILSASSSQTKKTPESDRGVLRIFTLEKPSRLPYQHGILDSRCRPCATPWHYRHQPHFSALSIGTPQEPAPPALANLQACAYIFKLRILYLEFGSHIGALEEACYTIASSARNEACNAVLASSLLISPA